MQETDTSPSIEIFCCYAHEDLALFRHLEQHLTAFKRERLATVWADVSMPAGTTWEEAIHHHLDTAQIVLLLISPAFISSDACFGEMDRALARERQGKTQVIPILLRPVNWERTPFSKLQMLPQGARPIESQHWSSRDEALEEVTRGYSPDYHSPASCAGTAPPDRTCCTGTASPDRTCCTGTASPDRTCCTKTPRQGSETCAPTATPTRPSSAAGAGQTGQQSQRLGVGIRSTADPEKAPVCRTLLASPPARRGHHWGRFLALRFPLPTTTTRYRHGPSSSL
jgi:hypothetical protein